MLRLAIVLVSSALLITGCRKKPEASPAPVGAAPKPLAQAAAPPAPPAAATGALRVALSELASDEARWGCPGDRPSEWRRLGPRTLSCALLGVMPWSRLETLSGLAPFASGPHTVQDGPRFDAVEAFGHYNPAFVAWASREVGTFAEAVASDAATRAAFEQTLRPIARLALLVQLELERDPTRRAFELAAYREALTEGRAVSPSALFDGYLTRSPLGPLAASDGAIEPLAEGPLVAFWLRRELDGTRAGFAELVERVLRAWDAPFVEEARRLARPAAPATAAWSGLQVLRLVEGAWRTLDEVQRNVGDSSEGTRGAWRWLYPRAEWLWSGAAVGLAPFRSGQPSDGSPLALRQRTNFGRYDPAFVAWLRRSAVPYFGDAQSREAAQATWRTHLAPVARSFWVAWRAYEEAPEARARDLSAFRAGLDSGALPADWYRSLQQPPDALAPVRAEAFGHRTPPKLGPEAQAFWLRRLIDGTAGEFAAGLRELLVTFDAAFLAALEPPVDAPGAAGAAPGDGGAAGGRDRPAAAGALPGAPPPATR